jgi:nucleoside-diphosphate-sugar epimerase
VAQKAHAQGLIKSGQAARVIDADEANRATSHGAVLWGTNAVYTSTRAQEVLGWRPSAPSLGDVIEETVELEAERLGRAK